MLPPSTVWRSVILRPATVYGPGSTDVVGEIARAIRARNMLLVDRGRAVAGLLYVDNLVDAAVLALGHDDAPGQVFNVSDGLAVTWRQFTDGLAAGLDCERVRWSMPYWMASGIGFSLEQGYRALRRTTGLTRRAAALAPGGAGARAQPGLQQPPGARDARLGAERRLRLRAERDRRLAEKRLPRACLAAQGLCGFASCAHGPVPATTRKPG